MKGLDPNTIKKYWKNQSPPDLKELKEQGKNFVDPYFPPGKNSLTSRDANGNFVDSVNGPTNLKDMEEDDRGSSNRLQWKRPTEVKNSKWQVFEGKIEFDDIKQGTIGDCYFLSAITALAEFPYLIKEKFRTSQFSDVGYYEVIFFVDGEWQIVFLDDYFPYDPDTRTFSYARPHNNELWAMLLEKAWAKLNGGFSNIIGGLVGEAISALTGFPTDFISHTNIDPDDLFIKIENGDKEGTIMSSGSKDTAKVQSKGLVRGHAYTLISAKEWPEKKIKLIKLRNPWGDTEWEGEWSDNSSKWTPEAKKFFGYNKANDGIFWIDVDNYVSNFSSTYICYLMYGAVIRNFYFEYERYFQAPVVFNIYITEKSKTSISVTFKNWRFNRDIHDPIHPFSMILCRYNKNREIEQMYSKFSCIDDIAIVETLEPGYYVLWLYTPHDFIVGDPSFKYALTISSVKNFQCQYIGMDSTFGLIQYLVIENYRKTGASNINSSKDYFIGIDRTLSKEGGIFGLLIYNKSEFWLDMIATPKTIKGIKILPPYTGTKSVSVLIPPQQSCAILGICVSKRGCEYSFSSSVAKKKMNREIPKVSNFENFLRFNISNDNNSNDLRSGSYRFVDKDKALTTPSFDQKEIIRNSTLRKEPITFESLRKQYPFEMDTLKNKFPENKEDKANKNWDKVEIKNYLYIGQIDQGTGFCHGIGVLFWLKDKIKYIGYWEKNKMSPKGLLLDDKNNLVYEGGYKEGLRDGYGTFYYSKDEYYQGQFAKNQFNGKGIYHFKNGDTWEGKFVDGMKQGVGILSQAQNNAKLLAEYDKNNLLGTITLGEKETKEIQKLQNESDNGDLGKNFMKGIGAFDKFINNAGNYANNLYREKTKIEASVIVQQSEKEAEETPEEKKHREHLEQIQKLNEEEPFIMGELKLLYPIQGHEEDFQKIDLGNGKKYVGGIHNGRKQGRGGYFDGENYFIGYFNNDVPSGFFKKFSKDKRIIFKGTLDQNFKILKFGVLYLPSGDKYKGSFVNEQMNGFGTYFFAKGDSWTGSFNNNTFNGVGKYFYENGLLTETVYYENNRVVRRENLQREDYSNPGAEQFFNQMRQRYPGVIETLLKIPPFRTDTALKWALFNFPDGNSYIGECRPDNVFHGRGCFVYLNGPIHYFVGYLNNGKFFGEGTYYDANWRLIYQGKFENNKRVEFGKTLNPDGTFYVGQFNNDLPEGSGVLYFRDGSRYEGRFLKGEKNDKGYLISPDSRFKQEVEYKENNIVFQGDLIDCSKSLYKKALQKKMNALCLLYLKQVKMFLDLQPTKDTLVLVKGTQNKEDGLYIGELNNAGFRHGRGYLESSNKNYYVGYFENDKKEGHGIIYYADGKPKYIGFFHNDKPLGKGKYFYSNGDVLEGEFNEVGEGFGLYTFSDGTYWKGSFYAWTLNGYGQYFDKNAQFLGNRSYRFSQLIG